MISVSSGVRRVVLLSLILTLSWAAIAQAQETPFDDEYGDPAPIPAVAAATDTGSASASGGTSGSAAVTPSTDTGSASASSGASGFAAVMPSTGGASLFALGAGVLLVGSGLVARRMIR